jgi:hypothetical protein
MAIESINPTIEEVVQRLAKPPSPKSMKRWRCRSRPLMLGARLPSSGGATSCEAVHYAPADTKDASKDSLPLTGLRSAPTTPTWSFDGQGVTGTSRKLGLGWKLGTFARCAFERVSPRLRGFTASQSPGPDAAPVGY